MCNIYKYKNELYTLYTRDPLEGPDDSIALLHADGMTICIVPEDQVWHVSFKEIVAWFKTSQYTERRN